MNQKKGSKSTPSNSKLDSEGFLSDNFTYMMGFNKFVNEAYDSDEAEVEKDATEDDQNKGNEEEETTEE